MLQKKKYKRKNNLKYLNTYKNRLIMCNNYITNNYYNKYMISLQKVKVKMYTMYEKQITCILHYYSVVLLIFDCFMVGEVSFEQIFQWCV